MEKVNATNIIVSCVCRNSVKLTILDYLNKYDQPIELLKLIEMMSEIVKKNNSELTIDDNFLKTYIQKIIEELYEDKTMYISHINI
jgi:hypothetical protein